MEFRVCRSVKGSVVAMAELMGLRRVQYSCGWLQLSLFGEW